jgi:surface protein
MNRMFYHCGKLKHIIGLEKFDTSKVTTMYGMFYNCLSLTSINVCNFDTSSLYNTGFMFYNCNKLSVIDLGNFKTNNVNDMGSMFYKCTNLTTLDISNFNINNSTTLTDMFKDCNAIKTLKMNNCDYYTIDQIIVNLPTLNNKGVIYSLYNNITKYDIDTVLAESKHWKVCGKPNRVGKGIFIGEQYL